MWQTEQRRYEILRVWSEQSSQRCDDESSSRLSAGVSRPSVDRVRQGSRWGVQLTRPRADPHHGERREKVACDHSQKVFRECAECLVESADSCRFVQRCVGARQQPSPHKKIQARSRSRANHGRTRGVCHQVSLVVPRSCPHVRLIRVSEPWRH